MESRDEDLQNQACDVIMNCNTDNMAEESDSSNWETRFSNRQARIIQLGLRTEMILSLVLWSGVFLVLSGLFWYFSKDTPPDCRLTKKSALGFTYACAFCFLFRILVNTPIVFVPWKMNTIALNQSALACMQFLEHAVLVVFLLLFTLQMSVFREECGALSSLLQNYLVVAYTVTLIVGVCFVVSRIPQYDYNQVDES